MYFFFSFFYQGLDLIEGRVLVEIQEMRGQLLTHQGFEKFCRVSVLNHTQNTPHPQNEYGNYEHDDHGHIKHKYDFAAILNFHFEVEQRSFEKIMVVIEVIHKHRITGEKVEGVIKLPISTLKHGEYSGGWHDVLALSKGKNAGKKIGQLNVRLLLHKEGLSKEQRRSTITKNLLDLDSSTNSLSDSAGSNSGGASKNNSSVGTVAAASKTQGGGGGGAPTQANIEAEARLVRLETELARVVQMMSDVAEAMSRLSAQ